MDISKKLCSIAKNIDATFTLKGSVISYEEIFADTGLLPGLTRRADQLSSLCFGYGLGASYEDVEKSLLKTKVKFDDFTPDILRIFCLVDVIFEIIKASPSKTDVALDELLYQ